MITYVSSQLTTAYSSKQEQTRLVANESYIDYDGVSKRITYHYIEV